MTPLRAILLFISLTEIVLGVAATRVDGAIQVAFTTFVLGFPLLILGVVFAFVWSKPTVLYSPAEFRSEGDSGGDQHAALLAVIDRLRAADDPFGALSEDEVQLQREISCELPADVRERYLHLSGRCQQETLTTAEHRELIELIDVVETNHAARLSRVLKLAQLRGTDFDELMQQFGLLREVA